MVVARNRERKFMTTQPATKFRDGTLQVTVWRNTSTSNGQTYYTFNPTRSFKKSDDAWGQTESLNADDLLPMGELLREAYAWVKAQKRADSKARKDAEKEAA
jgi:hypothetical protein